MYIIYIIEMDIIITDSEPLAFSPECLNKGCTAAQTEGKETAVVESSTRLTAPELIGKISAILPHYIYSI